MYQSVSRASLLVQAKLAKFAFLPSYLTDGTFNIVLDRIWAKK